MDIKLKLSTAVALLKQLGNALSDLVNSSPDVFNDPAIASRLGDFRQTHETAIQRLTNPSLSIATLGTTSSGKSTIVNALMGRRIAPIEAGEMSGGVLTLRHSEEKKLIIEATDDAAWETGEWLGLRDEELYHKIQVVMNTHHQCRQKKEYIAPKITVAAPLFPARDVGLSGLPEGINIEFLDLPGLKSVQDRANLAVIQPLVGKAFSLVALDYMQVDEEHRQKLLAELKQVVRYLHGRTDSMIFILNRVDNRGSDDLPVEVRLEKLRVEIKDILELVDLPDVIPFNARLLYYAQCAWGTTALNASSEVDPEVRSQLLKAFFQDCAAIIRDKTSGDHSLRDWFRQIDDNLQEGHPPDDYQMRRIMFYALEWSGGKALWSCLRRRTQESFSELVILPALFDVFNNFDALAGTLDILIETGKISNQEQVEIERNKIATTRRDLQKNVKRISGDFQKEVKGFIELLKADPNNRQEATAEAKKKGREGFLSILDAVSYVTGDLTTSLVATVRDAFKNNQSAYELEEKLKEVITPPLAKDIARSYDNVSRRMSKFAIQLDSENSEVLYRKVRADDLKEVKFLENDETEFRLLYRNMRQAITARASFSLQVKAKEIEQALQVLVNKQARKLEDYLSDQDLFSISLKQAVIIDLIKDLAKVPPTLPEGFFKIPDTIEQKNIPETQIDGTETYIDKEKRIRYDTKIEIYTEGSCFKSTKTRNTSIPVEYTEIVEKTRDKKVEVEYIHLSLPSIQPMAKQWSEGIAKEEEGLWNILCDWIINESDKISDVFKESVTDITDLAERALVEQLRVIESNFEKQRHFWSEFENSKHKADETRKQLEESLRKKET